MENMQQHQPPKLLRIDDAVVRYKICRTTIYTLMSKGVLIPIRIGRSIRFDIDQADAALTGRSD